MSEVELKLQLPSGATARVERELGDAPRRTRMQGLYFDTPDRRLAAAGLALRLRKEGRRWVQTLKGGAAHDIERAEHNVVVAASPGAAPQLDVARHAGTPGGEALAAALGEDGASALVARYRTDISRRVRVLRARRGCVELALDLGFIAARPAGVVDAANASSNAADAVERRWPSPKWRAAWPCATTCGSTRAARPSAATDSRAALPPTLRCRPLRRRR